MSEQKLYWIAHVRGPDYEQLRRKGFLVLYPDVDDYVFLEANEANKKLIKRAAEFAVSFLRVKGKFATVTETEIKKMQASTNKATFEAESEVEVISGYCENLEGKVLEQDGDRVRLQLQGYNRTYDVWVDALDIVRKDAQIERPKKPEDEAPAQGNEES